MEGIERSTGTNNFVKLSFFCPLVGNITDNECSSMQPVGNLYLKSHVWAIRELLEMEQSSPEDKMAQYFDKDDNVKAKLISAVWTVDEYKGTLYGRIDCCFKEELTENEMEIFKGWLLGQCSDGFGEHFEQQPIQTEEGELFVSFWNFSKNYFLCTENELDGYIKQVQKLQMGGNIKEKYYVAYGLNMNLDLMGYRCPHAERVGKCEIGDYALRFRGRRDNASASIVPQNGARVPAVVWKISESDEAIIDKYEGYPQVAQKQTILVMVNEEPIAASVYMISPMYAVGIPTGEYFALMLEAYAQSELDTNALMSALYYSLRRVHQNDAINESIKLEGS